MIRFALIVASVLGFALTTAVGNLLVPLLRALVPPEKETGPGGQPQSKDKEEPQPQPPRGLPTMGGLCFINRHPGRGGRGLGGGLPGAARTAGAAA